MRVHVVAPFQSPAMQQLVLPLLSTSPAWLQVSVSDIPDWNASLNYFVPWLGMLDTELKGPCVMYYTHTNPGAGKSVKWAADHSIHIVCMSSTGEHELRALGVTTPITVIHPGIQPFAPRKRNILIVGAEQPNGRKRSWILLDLAWKYDLHAFNFTIIGTGWEEVVTKLKNLGVSVTNESSITHEALQTYYQTSDALLVTGLVEGGPLPAVEALACGLPVISPAFGVVAELTRYVDISLYTNVDDLYWRLQELVRPIEKRHDTVASFTVDRHRDAHFDLFQQLLNIPVKSRYDWITKIVKEIQPRYLMEIGTCRGDSAEAMIKEALTTPQVGTINYYGYDLFRELTDAEMTTERSKQPADIKSVRTRLKALSRRSGDLLIYLYAGDTKDSLATGPYSGGPMDFIFIDGGHSWETIASDWKNVQKYINRDTRVLFDDYYTGEVGETGCQELINSLDPHLWNIEILSPQETWGELRINMVKVMKR